MFDDIIGPGFDHVMQVFSCLWKVVIPRLEDHSRCELFFWGRCSSGISHETCRPIPNIVDFAGEHEGKEFRNADMEEDDQGKDKMEAFSLG